MKEELILDCRGNIISAAENIKRVVVLDPFSLPIVVETVNPNLLSTIKVATEKARKKLGL